MSKLPLCSIVVPTHNGRRLLERCLASIAEHRPPRRSIEVIVVDDASTDGTEDWLRETYPEVKVVRLTRNQGFCAAANAGVDAATGEFIQLLNNDAEVTAGWLEAGLAPFQDATIGSVAPLVLFRSNPGRVDSAGDGYAAFGWPSKRGHGQDASRWLRGPIGKVFGASGSSAFYRASGLRSVGVFDPFFGSYYEDVDLAFRLRWAGYECVHAPECLILHDVSATYDHGSLALQRRMSRNSEILFWSNMPVGWLLAALIPHLAFTFAQGIARFFQGRHGPFLQGKLEAIGQWRTLADRRRIRRDLARSSIAQPRFPISLFSIDDFRNHLCRPKSFDRESNQVKADLSGRSVLP